MIYQVLLLVISPNKKINYTILGLHIVDKGQ